MAKNKPRRAFIIILFKLISIFILAIPTGIGLIIGQALGSFCFYILKKEREKALENLDIAFGDSKSIPEKRAIARRVFENLGKNFIEAVSIQKFNKSNMDKYISCKNADILRQLAAREGAIILSAHFGNWELLAHYISMLGLPINVIARRVRMKEFEAFLSRIRKKNKVNVIYRDASAKEIIDLLRNKKFVGIMPDQDMDSVSGVFVDFFGKSAWTPSGAAVLNLLTGVPIVPCFLVRRASGHEFLIGSPVELVKTGDKKKDILENTRRYTKVIEDYIRRFPEHWVWFHDRWKTKAV